LSYSTAGLVAHNPHHPAIQRDYLLYQEVLREIAWIVKLLGSWIEELALVREHAQTHACLGGRQL
jgi:hypothetical protein